MYRSASNVRTFEANSVSVYLRPIRTFEADPWATVAPLPASLADFTANRTLLPGRGSAIGREISETGRERECDPQATVQIGLKCTNRPQMYDRPQMYSCLSIYLSICTFEADFSKADR